MADGTHVAPAVAMQVANNQSRVVSGPSPGRQPTACLRLARGSSAQATWLLEDVAGGTTIRIGADPACDWQIRAASVPVLAVTAMLVGGTLFVKSSPDGGVLLDGRPLGMQWTEVASGSRIDIGLARIEVAVGAMSSAFAHLPQVYVPPSGARTELEAPHESLRTTECGPDEQDMETVDIDERTLARSESAAVTFAEITMPQEAARESITARESQVPHAGRPSLSERLSRPSLLGGPSLIDDGSRRSSRFNLRKLALCGMATVLAYVGWLAILDHL